MTDNYDKFDSQQQIAIASLTSRCEAYGVATIKFNDGEMFMMSKTFIENLLEKATASELEQVIVFVRSGPTMKAD